MSRASEATASDREAFRTCRNVCRRRGGDFYLATFFLPRPKRDAVHALFAFCCLIADAVQADDGEPSASPTPTTVGAACCSTNSFDQRVGLLRQRVVDIFTSPAAVPYADDRDADQAAVYAFAQTLRRHPMPQEYFTDLIEGARLEATVPRFATWKSLDRCLALRWGSIALAVAAILGLTNTGARDRVIDLGKAIGLIKILRRLPEDAAAGKVRVPLEDLARSGYGERDLLAQTMNDRRSDFLKLEIERARRLFNSAREAIPSLAGDGSRLAVATVITLYDRSLDRLNGSLSTWQRVRLLPRIWAAARA